MSTNIGDAYVRFRSLASKRKDVAYGAVDFDNSRKFQFHFSELYFVRSPDGFDVNRADFIDDALESSLDELVVRVEVLSRDSFSVQNILEDCPRVVLLLLNSFLQISYTDSTTKR